MLLVPYRTAMGNSGRQAMQECAIALCLQALDDFVGGKAFHVGQQRVDGQPFRDMNEQVNMVRHDHVAQGPAAFRCDQMHPLVDVVVEPGTFYERQPVPAGGRTEVDPFRCSLILVGGHYPKVKRALDLRASGSTS